MYKQILKTKSLDDEAIVKMLNSVWLKKTAFNKAWNRRPN